MTRDTEASSQRPGPDDSGVGAAVAEPLLRVLTPHTTPEEVAAIVAVFASLGGAAPASRKPRSAWASPARQVRGAMAPGVSGWRLSGLPRG